VYWAPPAARSQQLRPCSSGGGDASGAETGYGGVRKQTPEQDGGRHAERRCDGPFVRVTKDSVTAVAHAVSSAKHAVHEGRDILMPAPGF
jgi:hypothetical protein